MQYKAKQHAITKTYYLTENIIDFEQIEYLISKGVISKSNKRLKNLYATNDSSFEELYNVGDKYFIYGNNGNSLSLASIGTYNPTRRILSYQVSQYNRASITFYKVTQEIIDRVMSDFFNELNDLNCLSSSFNNNLIVVSTLSYLELYVRINYESWLDFIHDNLYALASHLTHKEPNISFRDYDILHNKVLRPSNKTIGKLFTNLELPGVDRKVLFDIKNYIPYWKSFTHNDPKVEIQLHLGPIANRIKQRIQYYDEKNKKLQINIDDEYDAVIRQAVLLLNTLTMQYQTEFIELDKQNPDLIYDYNHRKRGIMKYKIKRLVS